MCVNLRTTSRRYSVMSSDFYIIVRGTMFVSFSECWKPQTWSYSEIMWHSYWFYISNFCKYRSFLNLSVLFIRFIKLNFKIICSITLTKVPERVCGKNKISEILLYNLHILKFSLYFTFIFSAIFSKVCLAVSVIRSYYTCILRKKFRGSSKPESFQINEYKGSK